MRMLIAGEADKAIDTTLCVLVCVQAYRPCAQRASILFFVLNDLGCIDPMYQFSLDAYINLFTLSIESSPRSHKLEERINNLNRHHTYAVYRSETQTHTLIHMHIFTEVLLCDCAVFGVFSLHLHSYAPEVDFYSNLQMPLACTFFHFKMPFKNKFYCVLKHKNLFKNILHSYSNYFNCNKKKIIKAILMFV